MVIISPRKSKDAIGPWPTEKAREIDSWLKNKCPQRLFGGQAAVEGMVSVLHACLARGDAATKHEEMALCWAHVALELKASTASAGDFHKMWVEKVLAGTAGEIKTSAHAAAQAGGAPPETRDAATEMLSPAEAYALDTLREAASRAARSPRAAAQAPQLDLAKADGGGWSRTEREGRRSAKPTLSARRTQSAGSGLDSAESAHCAEKKREKLDAQRAEKEQREAQGSKKRAKFPTSKAPFSADFHSFRLIFGRAIISRNGEADELSFAPKLHRRISAPPPPPRREASKQDVLKEKNGEPKKKRPAALRKKRSSKSNAARAPSREPSPAAGEDAKPRLSPRTGLARRRRSSAPPPDENAAPAEAARGQRPRRARRGAPTCEFDRVDDGRAYVRLRKPGDIDQRHIFRKRAGKLGHDGATLSVGRDDKGREHVLQVILDADRYTPEQAHAYLLQHHHADYLAKRESGGDCAVAGA
ncbi:hypothetical protein JL721_6377 [Aureococcus anophagefferens]|nr:hypothetical protein JL721_6377 [Aureococcus anophagefferens]